jgi:endonuclease/exonuclease/phosphatase family metal-dependent hydrolase
MRKFVATFALLASLCTAPAARPAAAGPVQKPVALRVMTQNLYLGADLVPTIEALSDPNATTQQVADAVQAAWLIVRQTDFATRAKAIAAEIAAADPDVVALQEAVIWRSQSPSDIVTGNLLPNATHVEQDFVKMLLTELRRKRRSYRVAAVTTSIDVEAPRAAGAGQIDDLRLTDQDVLLVKSGVRASKAVRGTYQAALPLPVLGGLTVPRGFVAVDVTVRRKTFHVVATHLESESEEVRTAQAQEFAAGPVAAAGSTPTIVLGDFNIPAEQEVKEAGYSALTDAGLVDVWPVLHPTQPGLTWGQDERLDNSESHATQRLDLVFVKNGVVPTVALILGDQPCSKINGLWPSDHAGVVVTATLP